MKLPLWTYWAAFALAASAGAAGQSPARPVGSAGGSATRPASPDFGELSRAAGEIRISPADPTEVPITLPTMVKASGERRPTLPSGVMIINRTASIEKDQSGKWHTIKDPRVGVLYLLPCELLETVEKAHAETPEAKFNLSGEVHRYRGGYYMLLHRALLIVKPPTSAPAATTQPTTTAAATTKPAEPPVVSLVEPTSRPHGAVGPAASKPAKASADDVASELLRETPARPIVPVVKPKLPKTTPAPSGAPAGRPLQAGPGKTASHRLARLLPKEKDRQWARIAFEADNTLREPPMRILPNLYLERIETLSNDGTAFGAVFSISGEVHRYRGKDYLLLRVVITKRNMDQF